MSDRRDESLILGNGQQLGLLDVDEAGLPADVYSRVEASGRFTGERIFSGNPRLYQAIVRLLGRAVPYREVSEICSVSVNTVCAVAQREGIPIETIRERVGRMSMDVAALTIEAIRDMLADPVQRAALTLRDLSIAYGIAAQNGQLLLGGATVRMETIEAPPTHDDYLKMIQNVTPTGVGGETPVQKGALPAPAVPAIDVPSSMPGTSAPEATT